MSVLRNFEFVAELPKDWDSRTQIALAGSIIIIAHPEHPAMYLDDKEWKLIEIEEAE